MGQAVADLPNPLDAPPPASSSGTDDLLAQLAGDEIDRLLAEADVERTAPTPPAASTPQAAPAAVQPAPAPSSESPSPQASAAPASTPLPGGDELDQLLSQLNTQPSPNATPAVAAVDSSSAPAATKSLTEQVPDVLAQLAVNAPATLGPSAPAAPSESVDGVMSAAEREALSLSNLEAATAAAEQQDSSAAAAAAKAAAAAPAPETVSASGNAPVESGRINPLVRVLEWINAPLSFIPDAARDPLGKAAIVTIVNSIAVLVYVMFIRH